jgi:hypothetical protein
MKCNLCAWVEKPDRLDFIKTHIEKTHINQTWSVVWRDSELTVVQEAEENERVFNPMVVKPKPKDSPSLEVFEEYSEEVE